MLKSTRPLGKLFDYLFVLQTWAKLAETRNISEFKSSDLPSELKSTLLRKEHCDDQVEHAQLTSVSSPPLPVCPSFSKSFSSPVSHDLLTAHLGTRIRREHLEDTAPGNGYP